MHVILTILKILGIILLVLLGLLLVIVFSVLFVPVRYRLEGEKSSPGWSEANGKVRVSWLLHLIHLRIQYQEKELDWECYLFGVPLKKAGAAVREWKKKRRKKKVQEQKERRKKAVQQKNEPEKRTAVKHQVRPGLTGWAQVNGYRGNTSIRKRIDYDLYYIENWSVGLDVKIILLTFFKGFINKNAY